MTVRNILRIDKGNSGQGPELYDIILSKYADKEGIIGNMSEKNTLRGLAVQEFTGYSPEMFLEFVLQYQ